MRSSGCGRASKGVGWEGSKGYVQNAFGKLKSCFNVVLRLKNVLAKEVNKHMTR